MCNLYSMISNQETMRSLVKYISDFTGNILPLSGIWTPHWKSVRKPMRLRISRARCKPLSRLQFKRTADFSFNNKVVADRAVSHFVCYATALGAGRR